nr:hypothetical protein [Tanacetum cinerariifolium]
PTSSAGRPVSVGRPVSAGRPSGSAARTPVPAGCILGKLTSNTSYEQFPRASSVENLDIHNGLKIFDCPKSGIFTSSSYDEDFSGPDANKLEDSLNVSSTITKRIHNIHPTSQRRNNHPDFQLCMFSCFLSQEELTTVAQALANPNWVEAMQSAFLYGKIAEEVYVTQPRGFEDPDHPKKVYKLVKALYGLHQALRACSTRKDWCEEFETLMKSEFEMSSMGPLTFCLGLNVSQRPDGIFIHQEKYVADILKKFDLNNSKLASTPFEPQNIREKNVPDEPISVHLYRSMIGCLMYLTATRPDIKFAVCAATRHQVTLKTSNLLPVKRIFKYLTAYLKLGLWYPRDSPFDLEAFSDSYYAGANGDIKSTTGGCQFLGRSLISCDDFAAFLDGELDSTSDTQPETEEEEEEKEKNDDDDDDYDWDNDDHENYKSLIDRTKTEEDELCYRRTQWFNISYRENINSRSISEEDVTQEEGYLMNPDDPMQDKLKGSLFKLPFMHMVMKLRPFVYDFLKEASNLFEMYIYTMGERSYALEMANLLDPGMVYFNSKVIAQGDTTSHKEAFTLH